MAWKDYLDNYEITQEESVNVDNTPIAEEINTENLILDEEMTAEFFKRLSTESIDVSYGFYEYIEDTEPEYQVFTPKCKLRVCRNFLYDSIISVDFIFRDENDLPNSNHSDLKLFWANLREFRRKCAEESDKLWVFYIELRSNDFIAHIYNPIVPFLTREIPRQKIQDEIIDGIPQGGNVISMLIASNLFQISIV